MNMLSKRSTMVRKATYDVCPFCGSPPPDCVGAYNCPAIREHVDRELEKEKENDRLQQSPVHILV